MSSAPLTLRGTVSPLDGGPCRIAILDSEEQEWPVFPAERELIWQNVSVLLWKCCVLLWKMAFTIRSMCVPINFWMKMKHGSDFSE